MGRREEADRARTRFDDAEARGQDPYAATSRRINATAQTTKREGTHDFLTTLLQERPGNRTEIRELLAMLSDVGGAPAPPPRRASPPKAPRRATPRARSPQAPGWSAAAADLAAGILDLDESPRRSPSPRPHRASARAESPLAGVLLAKPWSGQDPTCYWMSEKLDGVRAVWDGAGGFWSRTGKPFRAPGWFQALMPAGVVLDGELWAGRGRFRETISAVRRDVPRDDQWRGIVYRVFDLPESKRPFETRMEELGRTVRESKHLEVVPQHVCGSRADLTRFHREIAKAGGEGVMLRLRGSSYEKKRSLTLLKVKDFRDEEARIVGHQRGEGKHAGRLGAYEAELLSSGARFRVGTGLTDADRERPLPRGTIITVRFQELTPDGIPRFPVYVGARDYE